MYKPHHNKDGSLKHSTDCKMVFGRKDAECPRCAEILAGAETRSGWQKGYFSKKQADEKKRLEDIKSHNCVERGCGSVCTAFEY